MLTDGQMDDGRTDDGVTGILIAHLGAFGSGELKMGGREWGSSQSIFKNGGKRVGFKPPL